MKQAELVKYFNRFKFGEDPSHTLMRFRVREVLLVSTFYDAFILEQDGRVADKVSLQFRQLNLTMEPRITSVPTGQEALRKLGSNLQYDMVITMSHIADMNLCQLSRKIKEKRPNIPVLVLDNSKERLTLCREPKEQKQKFIDTVFYWTGDPMIFLAMVKYIEDLANIDRDTKKGMVQVILLVEDSVRFYSRYLPKLYQEVMKQVQRLISEELSNTQRVYRMRTRPKVLMAHSYEQAIELCNRYADNLLCVITDLRYPNNGKPDPDAGIKLVHHLKKQIPDVPVAIQTAEESIELLAQKLGVAFLKKHSISLMADLSNFIHKSLGFGDFVFRDKKGRELDRAHTMAMFEKKLHTVSTESLEYHSTHNHFSTWLLAHGATQEARTMRQFSPSYFKSLEEMRIFLLEIFKRVRAEKNQGQIIDFDINNPIQQGEITRLAMGSLGGKGRGIAFLNSLLVATRFHDRYPELNIRVPVTAFIGTFEYDHFLRKNLIQEQFAQRLNHKDLEDTFIKKTFLRGRLSGSLRQKLSAYLRAVRGPIAVRSSGLLEDSQAQPFAGVYQTYMLPNSHPHHQTCLKQLEDAIRLVFASVFLRAAKSYITSVHFDTEQEKMAVIIQEVVGSKYGNFFYPHFSGVAQSYNYYPIAHMGNDDGIVSLALGLGYWVVEGNHCKRFCPVFPKLQILQPEELLTNSQRFFYAIDMCADEVDLTQGEMATLKKLSIDEAKKHGTLEKIASTWVVSDQRIRDTMYAKGIHIITFAGILKYENIPLAKALCDLLEIGETAFGLPVEMEFAVRLPQQDESRASLYVLQIRPLTVHRYMSDIEIKNIEQESTLLYTENAMGNGILEDIHHLIFIDPKKWDRTQTRKMRLEIAKLNKELNTKYILIGPGRWGSRDRFLGVPVQWTEIDQAAVIIETSQEGFVVEASQGTHFFHNVVAMNVGYFTVSHTSEKEFIDWEWLRAQKTLFQGKFVSMLQFDTPLTVKMRGKDGIALIQKPLKTSIITDEVDT